MLCNIHVLLSHVDQLLIVNFECACWSAIDSDLFDSFLQLISSHHNSMPLLSDANIQYVTNVPHNSKC